MTEYKNVADAIKLVNPDFYKWIKRDNPKIMKSNKSGTTFLIPDKNVAAQILDDDDPITIITRIRALKLESYVSSLTGFTSAIVNSISQYLPETSRATKDGVLLSNGSVITELPLTSSDKSVKCYLLSNHFIPIDGMDVDEEDEDNSKPPAPQPPQSSTYVDRKKFAKRVEKDFYNDYHKQRNEYLVNISSFMMYLCNNDPDKYNAILPILGVDPCSNFYILFEPYNRGNFHIVDSNTFNSWYDVRGLYMTNCVKFYNNMFEDLDKSTVLGDSKRSSLIKKLNKLKLDDIKTYSVSSVIGIVKNAYNQLDKGILHKIKNVYSAHTASILATKDLKLAQDEFRAIVAPRLYTEAQNKSKEGFKHQTKLLDIMYSFTDPTNQLAIISNNQIENTIDPYAYVEDTINPFLRSSYYCNIPTMSGEYINISAGNMDSNPDDVLYEAESQMWKYINALKYKDNTNHLSYLSTSKLPENVETSEVFNTMD